MTDLGYKNGIFHITVEKKRINRVSLFPVINFITGPPGVLRNSGIWKYIKEGIIKELLIPTIMTQVLHFTDFNITKNTFNRWWNDEGKSMTLVDRIKEVNPNYEFILFADSGGFKLLYNTQYDLSHLGIKATPESIFDLQVNKYGANLVASLDYPIPANLILSEAKERMHKSIKNAVLMMKLSQEYSGKILPYLAVHGRNKREISYYLDNLWNALQREKLIEKKFGLAIGSLVPLKNNYNAISEVVFSVITFLRKKEIFESNKLIPLHVFGITGNILPFLALYGIDTFDSHSAVQSAANLKFLDYDYEKFLIKSKYVFDLNDWHCDCSVCNALKQEITYPQFKKYLKAKPYRKLPNSRVKSYYYAQIALHNILKMTKFVEYVRVLLKNNELYDKLKKIAQKSGVRLFKNLIKRYDIFVKSGEIPKDYNSGYFISPQHKITLDYNLNEHHFVLKPINNQKKKLLLLLQCTKTKPYSKSLLHKTVFNYLNLSLNNRILNLIYKVTLSGLFGPVPEDYEHDNLVLSYDFLLSKYSLQQIRTIKKRLMKFLLLHRDDFKFIIAYVATRPYRDIVASVKDGLNLPNFILLPTKLRRHVSSELRREKNLKELKDIIINSIDALNQVSLFEIS